MLTHQEVSGVFSQLCFPHFHSQTRDHIKILRWEHRPTLKLPSTVRPTSSEVSRRRPLRRLKHKLALDLTVNNLHGTKELQPHMITQPFPPSAAAADAVIGARSVKSLPPGRSVEYSPLLTPPGRQELHGFLNRLGNPMGQYF